jgi:TolB-like protein/predicted ATPase
MEKSHTQTAETCVTCGRLLIPRGPNGECLRCLGSFAFALDRETSMKTPPIYAHFEVELGADGHPVELGAGAMGVTYRARDTILECTVALKIIDSLKAGNPAIRTRFLREARAAARLHHPNVARVTHYGEHDGECFYVMEFVEGETLEERVRREGPLTPTLALEVAIQVARALAAAESCGVIHRDLKPSNLMIASRQGESEAGDSLLVKVIDFGIAKIMGTGIDQTQAEFIGTPAYASPEQFRGSGETQVDTRSDIYSLGITLWYSISGRTPFVGRTLEEIQKKQTDELPLEQLRTAKVPARLTALLKSMLAVDPGDRPQSARELLDAIQRCRKEEADEPAKIEAALRREEGFWTAVLPFRFSGDPEIAEFAEGLAEEIATAMARFPYLRVIARNLTARYLSESVVARRVRNELGARYLLEGSLRQAGKKLRIAVQLADTESGEDLWAETFDRVWQAAEIFDLQDEITDRIIGSVADVYGLVARAIAATTAKKPPETLTPYEAVWRFFLTEGVKLSGLRTLEEEPRAATPTPDRPGTLLPVALRAELIGSRPGELASSPTSPVKRHSVGRQKELAELERAFESAAAGQGLFLCVTGEPGIGKTTLVEDFLSERAASGHPCALARGRCSERLAGTEAYLPFLEALESLLHGDGGEAAARVMKATAPNWYAQVVSTANEDSSLARVLAESKAATQERLKRELGTFLQELSHLRPLLLFFDDLHWADASTVDLLAYLGGKCAGMRALLVFTYRPTDLVVSKHPFGPVKLDLQARGVCRELALEFLTRSDLDRYLALEFPGHGFPEEFAALVHARTEGSPLFMADLLHYLRDRQVLTSEQGRWTLRESVPDLQRDLPESVRGMIQRKIDQLGEDDRRFLVAASVQGYEFDSAVVARVLERDEAEVEERLDELDRVHAFVRIVGEQEFPDRTLTPRYRFVHALYQNALYASLRPTRRALLSAAMAEALLGFYGEKSVDVAAELALLLEAGRDYAQAADYFLVAARNAARVFANQEAVVLARRGIELLASLPDTPERARKELALQVTLGPALFATKDWTAPEVEKAYTRAHVLCRQLGESPDLFPALWGLFLFHIARGEIQTALKQGEQLLGLAQRAQDPALLLQAHHALGPTYTLVGDWASARTHLDQAIAHYDLREHRAHAFLYGGHDPCVCCLSFAAKSLWMLGYPEQALQRGREALELARELGHPASLAHAQLSVAILHQFRRDVSETLELAEALLGLSADQGLSFYLSGGSVLRGWALVEQGRSTEGIAQIRQGFDTGGATRAHWRAYSLAVLAESCGRVGNISEGLTVLAEALTVVEETGICIYEPEMHRLKGEFLLGLDPEKMPDAEACFRQALAIARRHQARSLELRATMSLARLWQQQGRGNEARAALAAVHGAYTEGFTTPDLVEATAQLNSLA